ncbi:MAG: hypothetical protein KZQ64_02290 [gamma proteobacterium symbiont of Bathyaustriella thionipta]|nr:hypothetical protein [gamma proteobacterium symbiont of Bathyaustriella thionipta]MCU7952218.1 hypothetical protein [gamma proteobacterium symbiont of Bathyaustriella thionipta]MCU7967832.1 hypothetical protein [gamma proteobacterium symbiont of Bathyaustriella thionipta]
MNNTIDEKKTNEEPFVEKPETQKVGWFDEQSKIKGNYPTLEVTRKTNNIQEVIVTNFDIPFWQLVVLMVKTAIAAIPAFIILVIAGAIFMAIFGNLLF